MALTVKEKVLAGVGISVAAGCKPCTDSMVAKARQAKATEEEIRQAIIAAVGVRHSATQMMEGRGLRHLGAAGDAGDGNRVAETSRLKELVSIGAGFAVNCTASLGRHLKAGRALGVTEDEVRTVVGLAVYIKAQAASHVAHLAGMDEDSENNRSQVIPTDCPFSGESETVA